VSDVSAILGRNLAAVEERIAAACRRAGRARSEVTLVAVTKYVDADTIRGLWEQGVTDIGESRPQELWKKAAVVNAQELWRSQPEREVRWHLVGHLQRNKVERTLPLVRLIHSVDSLRLLEALELEAKRLSNRLHEDRIIQVLLEFNLSGEQAKHGFAQDDVPLLLQALKPLRQIQIVGLMTMAAQVADPQQARPTFATLRRLREQLNSDIPVGHDLRHLSMGMSNDFEIAIEEGATIVRIGSALFEGLETASP
jgi:pyridoxal phosphate enzyme (YggS family)